jgi:hypothetical protein
MSGSAEYIDKVFEDAERLGVLANDYSGFICCLKPGF